MQYGHPQNMPTDSQHWSVSKRSNFIGTDKISFQIHLAKPHFLRLECQTSNIILIAL